MSNSKGVAEIEMVIAMALRSGGVDISPNNEVSPYRFEFGLDQLKAFYTEAHAQGFAEGLEAAAKVCEDALTTGMLPSYRVIHNHACNSCAADIRQLQPTANQNLIEVCKQ